MDSDSVVANLRRELETNYLEFEKRDRATKATATSHAVRGAAKAWCVDPQSEGSEFVPCYSFRVDTKLSGTDSTTLLVDQPAISMR